MPADTALGTATVDVRAKIDNFDRDLASVQQKLQGFDQSAQKTSQTVKGFANDNDSAAASTAALTASLEKTAAALAAVANSNQKSAEATKANTDAVSKSSDESKKAAEAYADHNKGLLETGKSAADTALHILKIAGYIKLAGTVAYAASPMFKGLTDGFTGMFKSVSGGEPLIEGLGKKIASLGPAFAGIGGSVTSFGQGVTKATETLKPFQAIAGAKDIVDLGTNFTLAAAGAAALSPAVRQVAAKEVTDGIKAIPQAIGLITPAVRELRPAADAAGVALGRMAENAVSGTAGTGLRILPTAIGSAATATKNLTVLAYEAGQVLARTFAPLLAFASAIAVPIIAAVGAFQALVGIFNLGKKAVDDLDDSVKEFDGIVSRHTVENYTSALEDLNIKGELAVDMFKKLSAASQEKFGGSDLDKTIKEMERQGNFKDFESIGALKTATTPESRLKALSEFMDEAEEKGQRLAALKVADSLLPPDIAQRLRIIPDLLNTIIDRGEEAEKIDLVKEENLATALRLKQALEEAYDILHAKWEIVLPNLTALGLKFYGVWVGIVSFVAQTLDSLGKIGSWLTENVPFADKLGAAFQNMAVGLAAVQALMVAGPGAAVAVLNGATAATKKATEADNDRAAALRRYTILAQDNNNVLRAQMETTAQSNALRPDLSKQEADWDRLTKSVQKHIDAERFQILTSEAGAVASARLKTQTELEAGAIEKLGKITPETAAQIAKMVDAAGKAAAGLEHIQWEKQITQMNKHAATIEADTQAVGQGAAAQAALRVQLQLVEFAASKHITINAEMQAEMDKLASRTAAATQAFNKMKIALDISRERQGFGLTDEDVQIAEKLKEVYPQIADALQSVEASQMRFNNMIKQARDVGQTFTTDFIMGMRQGKTAMQSLQDALNNLANKLIEIATQQLWQKAFGASINSLLGGGLGGGVPGTSAPVGVVGSAGPMVVPTFQHTGGVAGSSGYTRGQFPASMFSNAPRFHNGGLADDEMPAILRRGERVIPQGGHGMMPPSSNNVTIENHGADIQTQKKRNSSGGTDIRVMIRQAVQDDFANGRFDNVLTQRHGIRPTTVRRG